MTTARELIIDSLEDLVVQEDEATIEPSEATTAIRAMNTLMSRLAAQGLSFGYTEVDSLDDEITIPDGAIYGLTAMLAYRLAPKYLTGEVPSTLLIAAKEGLDAMRHIGVELSGVDFPDTLPRGSGNDSGYLADDTFYSTPESVIDSESNDAIQLEDSTEEA